MEKVFDLCSPVIKRINEVFGFAGNEKEVGKNLELPFLLQVSWFYRSVKHYVLPKVQCCGPGISGCPNWASELRAAKS